MDLLFLLTTPFLGYYLNRHGKQSREIKDSVVSGQNTNGSDLLRTGNRTKEVRDQVQQLASRKHPSKVRSLFGTAAGAPPGIFFTNDQLDNFAGAQVSSANDDSAASRFERQLGGLIKNPELLAYDPSTGGALTPKQSPVENISTFRKWEVKGSPAVPLSPLTGLPLDMTHNNMQPFFGKHSFGGADSPNRDTLLERFTGTVDVPPRHEELNTNILSPNKFPEAGLSSAQSSGLERAMSSVRPSNEYVKPFKGFRDTPDIRSATRVLPPDIDTMRGPGKEKQVYGGGVVLGQLGSTRPMQPGLRENRYDLAFENDELLPTQAAFSMGSNNAVPSLNDKPTYATEYMGVPTFPMRSSDVTSMADGLRNTRDATVGRRQETWTPALTAPTGRRSAAKQGTIIARDPEKGRAGVIPAAPHQSINDRVRNVSAPETTSRELTQFNPHSGTMNPSAGSRTDGSYKIVNPVIPITNKAMNSDGTYVGPATGEKQRPMKQNFDLRETYKEINCVSVTGNPDVQTRLPPVTPRHDLVETFRAMNLTEQRGNPTGRTRGAPSKPEFADDPTLKETVLHAVAGNPQSRMRSAAIVGSHENIMATDREMNSSSHSGAPRAPIPTHMSYETVFDLSDSTMENYYVAAPRNPEWRHTNGPGEATSGTKEALTVERFGNPESREKRHERTSREETKLTGKEEVPGQVGNPYHPNASMAGHETEVSLKDGLVVEGRFESALARDPGGLGRLSFSFDLKDDPQGQSTCGSLRTLPRALMSPEPGINVRSVNTEVLNSRLDPSIRTPRLTSDIFPVVN